MAITRSYQNYLTVPSAVISDGLLPIPLWAVTAMTLNETYHLPAIGTSGSRSIVSTHDDTISLSGMLVGAERYAWKFALETMAESSKRGTPLEAWTSGAVSGLILITSMTIRTDMQIQSLSFSSTAAKRDAISVSISMAHMPRPSVLGKLLDVASLGVGALADWGGKLMSNLIFPIEEYLVAETIEAPSAEFSIVERKLMQGLPQKIELDADVHLFVVVPNGLANIWRDSEPTLILSCNHDENSLFDPGKSISYPNADRIPACLLVRRASEVKASIPLVSDMRVIVDVSSTTTPCLIELNIMDWDIRCGVMRDNGDYNASIRFAWRKIEKAVEQYSTPPINPYVIKRLKPVYRMESLLGLKKIKVMSRFSYKQRRIKEVQ